VPQVEVIFDIDANGLIHVSAVDKATNKSQSIRIEASSGLSKEDIEKMKKEAELNADADRRAKESADLVNQADQLIFQVEKQLKEFGDKLPADKKGQIESGLEDLKKAHAEKDLDRIRVAMDALNATFQAASQEMYNQSGGAGQAGGQNTGGSDAEVTDVDFEEVKDEKK
jgi:molecular chaperone DnaK